MTSFQSQTNNVHKDCIILDEINDIVFARGGLRPTKRTEQFYSFLRKLMPIYENSKGWTRQCFVRCITKSYTCGRFLKKRGSTGYTLLSNEQVHEQIAITYRAIRARENLAQRKLKEAAENLTHFRLPNHAVSPSVSYKAPSSNPKFQFNTALFRNILAGLTSPEKTIFASQLDKYENLLNETSLVACEKLYNERHKSTT